MTQLSMFDPIELPLTKGLFALIDPLDSDLVAYKWCASKVPGDKFYALRHGERPKKPVILLHRVIMERVLGRSLTQREFVDHADGNPLNNTRANLRIATPSQNQWNSARPRINTSGFKGVSLYKAKQKWQAAIKAENKSFHLGYYDTPEAAALAYDEAARKYHGEFARLNFPQDAR